MSAVQPSALPRIASVQQRSEMLQSQHKKMRDLTPYELKCTDLNQATPFLQYSAVPAIAADDDQTAVQFAQQLPNDERLKKGSQNSERQYASENRHLQNAAKYYAPPGVPARRHQNDESRARSRDSEVQRANLSALNDSFQRQNQPMRAISDNMSRNILLYAPLTLARDKLQPPKYPESLKKIDKQIIKYRKALERALHNQQLLQIKQEQYPEEAQEQNAEYDEAGGANKFEFLTGVGIEKQVEEVESNNGTAADNADETTRLEGLEKQQPAYNNNILQSTDIAAGVAAQAPTQYVDVKAAFERAYEAYQSEISRIFLKREQFPRRAARRRVPKLYITAKNNSVIRGQLCQDEVEHAMRVYNHEHLPSKPSVLVPTFSTKKDLIASTVVAYMKDYRPLITGEKRDLPKGIQSLLEEELAMLRQIEQLPEVLQKQRDGLDSVQAQPRQTSPRSIQNSDVDVRFPQLRDHSQSTQQKKFQENRK